MTWKYLSVFSETDTVNMKIRIRIWNDDPDENEPSETSEIEFPAYNVVCWKCKGKGKHVNPAVDGNGLSREDLDEDPDFRDGYFSGSFDITCTECKGKNVLLVVDEERLNPTEKVIYDKWSDQEYDRQARESEDRHTQWMEAGCPR